jgi:hypothetical protein
MTIESYLRLYSYVLFGGIWTILVLAALTLFGYWIWKWTRACMKLIDRNLERNLRNGTLTKKWNKAKIALATQFVPKKAEAGK